MAGKAAVAEVKAKVKAPKLDISQLVVISANERVFSTGKKGWFGKCMDPSTGKRYQVIGAVEIAS